MEEPTAPSGGLPEQPPVVHDPDAWKSVVMGQASHDLLPPHPGPPEAPEDDLTREALEDPAAESREDEHTHPTLWRVVVLMVVALAALSVVFGLGR